MSACGSSGSSPLPTPSSSEALSADQSMNDFVMDAYSDGKRDWTLAAPKANLYETDNSIVVEKPVVDFYESEQLSSGFTAGRARLDTQTKDMRAWDGVVLTSTDGARLVSDWFRYERSRDLIVSTAPVVVERRGAVVRGIGWEATPDLSTLSVERQTLEIEGTPERRRDGRAE